MRSRVALYLLLAPCVHAEGRPIAIVDVSVVPMDTERVIPHQTVVVVDARIAAIGAESLVRFPEATFKIDGRGKFLVPGLADMHVHFVRPAAPGQFQPSASSDYAAENRVLALLFVANGVTTVRNMWGHQAIQNLSKDIDKGKLIGPHIYSTGPISDGLPLIWEGSRAVETRAQAQEAARSDKESGYIAVKVYNQLSVEAYKALVAAAREEGLLSVGHVPNAVGLLGAIAARQDSVEHLTGYPRALQPDGDTTAVRSPKELLNRVDFSKLPAIAEAVRSAGIWNCPTLVLAGSRSNTLTLTEERSLVPTTIVERYEKAYPHWREDEDSARKALATNIAITSALHSAGAPLLLGTDTYKPNVLPGFSLHQELQLFVRAGLTPYQAIRAGTIDAARFLRREDEFGTVAVGRRADLILLEANPLDDVANLAKRVGVLLNGQWLRSAEIQRQLTLLHTRAQH